ncbi:UNVERIFIED_CONTAM: hypothetical protein GTU68_008016 [Idotea baltica]|nr:hypothetical protein [Idotea baltica]
MMKVSITVYAVILLYLILQLNLVLARVGQALHNLLKKTLLSTKKIHLMVWYALK